MKKRLITFLGGFLIALLLVLGLKIAPPTPVTTQSTSLLVGAAASLQNALQELDPLFERSHTGLVVNYNFAASGPLQQQIEQGAPIDVFISAATTQMNNLEHNNLILTNTRRNLLTNHLVLIAPSNSSLGLTDFRQLTSRNVHHIAVGEPRSVPAGRYAEEVFTHLGILDQVRSKFVYGNSVRNVLSAVESGNADAGIVYLTDAKISNQVRQVATAPNNLYSPIVYPIAVVRASRHPQQAQAYAEFLRSNTTQNVFRRYGFGIAA